MAGFSVHQLAFAFGLLGNIVSFLVFLAPMPTFYRICKKKSTEEFQSIPYLVALFSAMILLYYGFIKTDGILIITINAFGCIIESVYLVIYLVYAPKAAKVSTIKIFLIFNVGGSGLLVLSTMLLAHGYKRRMIIGWVCGTFSVSVFAAPLSIMRKVIKTKSVEYMPFPLSLCLTLCAITWFFYGIFIKDYYIALPNVLGVLFGIAQMILYVVYKQDVNVQDGSKMNKDIEMNIEENPRMEPSSTQKDDVNIDNQVSNNAKGNNGYDAMFGTHLPARSDYI